MPAERQPMAGQHVQEIPDDAVHDSIVKIADSSREYQSDRHMGKRVVGSGQLSEYEQADHERRNCEADEEETLIWSDAKDCAVVDHQLHFQEIGRHDLDAGMGRNGVVIGMSAKLLPIQNDWSIRDIRKSP